MNPMRRPEVAGLTAREVLETSKAEETYKPRASIELMTMLALVARSMTSLDSRMMGVTKNPGDIKMMMRWPGSDRIRPITASRLRKENWVSDSPCESSRWAAACANDAAPCELLEHAAASWVATC